MTSTWPGWTSGQTWLRTVLDLAVEEARERGEAEVRPLHLALALSRTDSEALGDAGLDARAWRDEMNVVLGMNRQIYREVTQSVGSDPQSAAERRYGGEISVSERVLVTLIRLQELAGDARRASTGPLALLAVLMEDAGSIEASTARFWGMTLPAARLAAGFEVPRRVLLSSDIEVGPPPTLAAPVLLIGGGHRLPTAALAQMVSTHGGRSIACLVPGHHPGARGVLERFWGDALKHAGASGTPRLDWFDRSASHQPAVADLIEGADLVVLDAGSVEEGLASAVGTPALDQLSARVAEGAGLVAYSRGAQLLGTGTLSSWESWGETEEPLALLGWLSYVVMPHGSSPSALADLRRAMSAFPGRPGLGLAHEGAVMIHGDGSLVQMDTGYEGGSVLLASPEATPEALA